MPRAHCDIVIMCDQGSAIRQLRLPARVLRLATFAGVCVALSAVLLAGALVFHSKRGMDAHRLAGETGVLAAELDEVRRQVDRLAHGAQVLAHGGAGVRRAAGLDPLHPEVLEVGIGGPGSRTPHEHPLWPSNRDLAAAAFAADYDLAALERRVHLQGESLREAGDSIRVHRDVLLATPSMLPTPGRISSSFARSRMHPVHGRALPHTGVDISAPRGTAIVAPAAGTVTRVGWRAGYGLSVELDHGRGYRTLYAHASETLVQRGDRVERGDLIARVGNTGTATAPHLHYEVLFNGRPQNPMGYVISGFAP